MIRKLSSWLVVGLAGVAVIGGCGESGSSTSTITEAATGAAKTATPNTTAAGPAAADASATSEPSTKSAWSSTKCNTELIVWYKGHASSGSQAEHLYKQSLRLHHGCFTASSLESKLASTSAWNGAQCNAALLGWYNGHRGSSAQTAQAYKHTLRSQHGCFTASSRTANPVSAKPAWNGAQCNAALLSWARSHRGSSAQAEQAYKHTLRTEHGCFTAASRNPAPPSAKG